MGSSSTSWLSESNTHAGSSKAYDSTSWSLYTTTSGLRISGAEGQTAQLELWADEGDDNADKWLWDVADGGSMTWQSYTGGSYATKLTLSTAGALTVAGATQLNSTLTIGANTDGHDVKFFGNASGKYMLWDESDDSLVLKGSTASSSGIKIDGASTNGISILSDLYVTDESQFNAGITYSHGATYLSNRVYGASDAVYTASDGWKSSQNASSARGTAIVLDGTAGSISLYYGASDATVSPGSDKVITQGFYLGEDGDVGIGNAAPSARLHVVDADTTATAHVAMFECTESAVETADVLVRMDFSADADVDGARAISFHDSGGEIGSVTLDGNATAFNTSSDYRLKTDLKDIPNATAIINQLKIYDFSWKKNTSKRLTGVLAHEAQAIVPYAINGDKDAMVDRIVTQAQEEIKDDQENIIQAKVDEVTESIVSPQAVDYSKFVPLLIQSIQELSAKVTVLENA